MPPAQRRAHQRRLYLLGLAALLLALLAPATALAQPSACQLVPRATVARVLGLPHVTTYSVAAPYQCGLAAWSKTRPTIPAISPAAGKRLNAALRAGQVALLHVLVEPGSSLEVLTLEDLPRTPFSLPLYGADGMRAGGEVLRNASEVGGGWWWLNPPGSEPAPSWSAAIRQTVVLRIVQYHRGFGQLQKELSRVAAVGVPRVRL